MPGSFSFSFKSKLYKKNRKTVMSMFFFKYLLFSCQTHPTQHFWSMWTHTRVYLEILLLHRSGLEHNEIRVNVTFVNWDRWLEYNSNHAAHSLMREKVCASHMFNLTFFQVGHRVNSTHHPLNETQWPTSYL